jgi:cysteine synthase A
MQGAIDRANEMVSENPKAWMPMQFDNPANPKVHMETTAREILTDFPEGIDYIFGGVGSGGHITGCAEALKKVFPGLKVFAIEPETSPVLSGGKPGRHALQGLGAGFIPGVMKPDLLDGIITISKAEAYNYTICAAKQEGLFIGISSGAVLAAIAKMLPEIKDGSKILGFNYDSGERYLSVDDLFEA